MFEGIKKLLSRFSRSDKDNPGPPPASQEGFPLQPPVYPYPPYGQFGHQGLIQYGYPFPHPYPQYGPPSERNTQAHWTYPHFSPSYPPPFPLQYPQLPMQYPPPRPQTVLHSGFESGPQSSPPNPQNVGIRPPLPDTQAISPAIDTTVQKNGVADAFAQKNPGLKNLDADSLDWPQGLQRREYPHGIEPPRWNVTKWAWRSGGNIKLHGILAEYRVCVGILHCTNLKCKRPIRPKTHTSARKLQMADYCPSCSSEVEHVKCNVRSYYYKRSRDGVVYSVWEHGDEKVNEHFHDRPPGGGLSHRELDALDEQVKRRAEASVHSLRTGDILPGSVPLADISATLANPRAARYQVSQSQARLGISPAVSFKSGLSIFSALMNLQEELKPPFIIDSSIHGPVFLIFQTPFMKQLLEESVLNWSIDTQGGPHASRHGMVTDGDHTFFSEGVLNVSCTFSVVLAAWVPVLYTWIQRLDVAHHRPHFRHISQSVVRFMQSSPEKIKFDSKYLLHVMDFSSAQRLAHAEEYADAVILTKVDFHSLTPASQKIERDRYILEAQKAESGCDFHFWQSAERLKKNGALVPLDGRDEFMHLLRRMTAPSTSINDFNTAVEDIRSVFPKINSWLSWWLRPAFASMIFPACSSLDPEVVAQIPKTANPAEHNHSLLHHAVGKDQDLIPGIKKLFLHVQQLEKQYNAIKAGHYNPPPPREYRPPPHKENHINDGRPPDTESSLHPKGVRDASTENANHFQAYIWQGPNSCFFDNGLELWFRAFALWGDDDRADFLTLVPNESFLATLAYHYDRRISHIFTPTPLITVTRNLGLMQTITRDRIFRKWGLYERPDEMGCSKTWLVHAVKDENPSREAMGHFGVYHVITRRCGRGHSEDIYATETPQVLVTLINHEIHLARHTTGKSYVNLTDYFASVIPRRLIGNYSNGTTPLHVLEDTNCVERMCSENAPIIHISTLWPRVLNIISDASGDSANADINQRVRFERSFTIPDSDGSVVIYELVGRVLYEHSHFTTQLQYGGQAFEYDGRKHQGKLLRCNNTNLLEGSDRRATYYVYHRRSKKGKTVRDVQSIKNDHDLVRPATNKDNPVVISESGADSPALEPTQDVTQDVSVIPSAPDHPKIHSSPYSLFLQEYTPDAYKICDDSCIMAEILKDILISCTLCKTEWHEECVEHTYTPGFISGFDSPWCCPVCLNEVNGAWDHLMIDQYILLQPTSSARFFPAKILGRSSTSEVHLEWHEGNVYGPSEIPSENIIIINPQACLQAFYLEASKCTDKTIGTIRWPVELIYDANETHDYQNPAVQNVLEDAFYSVKQVLEQSNQHPIIPFFNAWISRMRPPPTGSTFSRQHYELGYLIDFQTKFNIDILPADESLIDPFIADLKSSLAASSSEASKYAQVLGLILFRLVIFRFYLGKPPQYDHQIFWLALNMPQEDLDNLREDDIFAEAKCGSLVRNLTIPEQAMASCVGPRNLHPLKLLDAFTGIKGTAHHLNTFTSADDSPMGLPIVRALGGAGSDYIFFATTETGLTGGPPFSPYIRRIPVFTNHSNQTRPKPRPHPVKKTTSKQPQQPQSSGEPRILLRHYVPGQLEPSINAQVPLNPGKEETKGVSKRGADHDEIGGPSLRRSKRNKKV